MARDEAAFKIEVGARVLVRGKYAGVSWFLVFT